MFKKKKMTHSYADSWSGAFMAQQGVTGDLKFTHNTFISQPVAAQSRRTAAGNTAIPRLQRCNIHSYQLTEGADAAFFS